MVVHAAQNCVLAQCFGCFTSECLILFQVFFDDVQDGFLYNIQGWVSGYGRLWKRHGSFTCQGDWPNKAWKCLCSKLTHPSTLCETKHVQSLLHMFQLLYLLKRMSVMCLSVWMFNSESYTTTGKIFEISEWKLKMVE